MVVIVVAMVLLLVCSAACGWGCYRRGRRASQKQPRGPLKTTQNPIFEHAVSTPPNHQAAVYEEIHLSKSGESDPRAEELGAAGYAVFLPQADKQLAASDYEAPVALNPAYFGVDNARVALDENACVAANGYRQVGDTQNNSAYSGFDNARVALDENAYVAANGDLQVGDTQNNSAYSGFDNARVALDENAYVAANGYRQVGDTQNNSAYSGFDNARVALDENAYVAANGDLQVGNKQDNSAA
jgi:hypothetical protein